MLTSFLAAVGSGLGRVPVERVIENGTEVSGLAAVPLGLIDFLAKFSAGDIVRLSMIAIILAAFLYALTQPISK